MVLLIENLFIHIKYAHFSLKFMIYWYTHKENSTMPFNWRVLHLRQYTWIISLYFTTK